MEERNHLLYCYLCIHLCHLYVLKKERFQDHGGHGGNGGHRQRGEDAYLKHSFQDLLSILVQRE